MSSEGALVSAYRANVSQQTSACRFAKSLRLIKRSMDLAVAVPLCVMLAPVFAMLAAAIKLESPGPVFFRQHRFGQGMRPFTIFKFRSLRHNVPDPRERYEMLEHDPRITRVGAFLRNTSLDELPQLFNVIAGSMSMVGPRPLVEWESLESLRNHAERFEVKPGITGLCQITVRNSVDLDSRLDADVEYVRHLSLWLDLVLLLKTPWYVLRRQAIYPKG
jgi:lipopolysaccharide/colanic/teichoic acid biosynthesis glycosyltransferase